MINLDSYENLLNKITELLQLKCEVQPICKSNFENTGVEF